MAAKDPLLPAGGGGEGYGAAADGSRSASPHSGEDDSPRRVKIRLVNMCCEKEKQLVTRALGPQTGPLMDGVQSYYVNMPSKMVVINYQAPADPTGMVKKLNEMYLGASIHEEAGDDDATPAQKCRAAILASPTLYIATAQTVLAVGWLVLPEPYSGWDLCAVAGVGAASLIAKQVGVMGHALRRACDRGDGDSAAARVCHSLRDAFSPDMTTLMLVASAGAVMMGQAGEAALLLYLYSLAQLLQASVLAYAAAHVDSCGNALPSVAHCYPTREPIALDDVRPGVTMLQVSVGEAVPLDGDVVAPTTAAYLDEKAINGESAPQFKQPGDKVRAGTLLVSGFLVLKASRKAGASFAAEIQEKVQEAAYSRTPRQDTIDRFAKFYTIVVLSGAGTLLAMAVVQPARAREWVQSALLLIVLGCPCALVTAAPIVATCGVAAAARPVHADGSGGGGVLIKHASALECLGKVTCVCFDKTGTLTDGVFNVRDLWTAEGAAPALDAVAALEAMSAHPLASAITTHHVGCITEAVNATQMAELRRLITGRVETKEGMGLSAQAAGVGHLKVGKREFVGLPAERASAGGRWRPGWDAAGTTVHKTGAEPLGAFVSRMGGCTLVYASADRRLIACYALCDAAREPSAYDAVEWLQGTSAGKLGLRVEMLSGDRTEVVDAVASQLGIEHRHGGLMPEDKLRRVREAGAGGEGHVVLMAGDGINDGPALAAADVGWAMGAGGTALASRSAHVVGTTDDVRALPAAVQHGRNCARLVKQNIAIAVAPKFTLAVLTVFGVWRAPLYVAVAADTGCLCAVLVNGMRALQWPAPPVIWDVRDLRDVAAA